MKNLRCINPFGFSIFFATILAIILATNHGAIAQDKISIDSHIVDNSTIEENYLGDINIDLSAMSYRTYYNWGRARNGYGYCYEYTERGDVLNGGSPVSDYLCERVRPSYVNWGQGRDGWGYCYQYTPYGVTMNAGSPIGDYRCERVSRSYYRFGRGRDGYTHCYQYTSRGHAMNRGQPVSDHYCRR